MKYPDTRLIIFCKAPVPGKVKTRLIPMLGIEGATELHKRLTLLNLERLVESELCEMELWCTPTIQHEFFIYCRNRYGLALRLQQGRDLGERMAYSIKQVLSKARYVIIIGTDCPVIDCNYIQQAIKILNQNTDMVVGPAEDGGYVLLGLSKYNENVFKNISWGSSEVLSQTRQAAAEQGLIVKELPFCWDVDRVEDVARLSSSAISLPVLDG